MYSKKKSGLSPPLVGQVCVNFCGYRLPRGQRDGSLWPYSRFSSPEPLLFLPIPQLYSLGSADPVPDPVLLRKSGSVGNGTQSSGSVAKNYTAQSRSKVYYYYYYYYYYGSTTLCWALAAFPVS
jgi:hypothetical protein